MTHFLGARGSARDWSAQCMAGGAQLARADLTLSESWSGSAQTVHQRLLIPAQRLPRGEEVGATAAAEPAVRKAAWCFSVVIPAIPATAPLHRKRQAFNTVLSAVPPARGSVFVKHPPGFTRETVQYGKAAGCAFFLLELGAR